LDELFYEPFYQLMRLGLLADKMVHDKEFGITEAKVVVVCPEGNIAYRETITSPVLKTRFPAAATVEQAVKSALRAPACFTMTSPEALVAAVRQSQGSEKLSEWLGYQHERYGY
jgi:hypothetical protein